MKDFEFFWKYVENMVDGEFIENIDVVVWVVLGFFYIFILEDVFMMIKVIFGFILKFFNFFDKMVVFDILFYVVGVNKIKYFLWIFCLLCFLYIFGKVWDFLCFLGCRLV